MLITVNTFNGHTLNSADYQTVLLNPHGTPTAKPVYLEQNNADPVDVNTYTVNTQTKVLSITVKDYADRDALIAQLKTWFKRGESGNLVATFSDDGVDYQLPCKVVSLVQDPQISLLFTATLQTGTSAWRAVTEDTVATWTVTGTSDTKNVTVGGKDETFLSMELTAVAGPASGYLFQNIYQLPNTPNVEHGLIPWCITLNTSTLIGAGKMQSDCDDLRVVDMNTGQEIKRWISGANTTTTKVWVNLDLKKGFALTLGTAVSGSGSVTYLQFVVNVDNQTKIANMPKTGIVYHGNEWFSYTSTDSVKCRLYVGARGLFGTTEEAHLANTTFNYIQYPLLIKYGNASVSAPSTTDANYDDEKPLFSLSSSSNTSWVWSASDLFYDPDHPNRTGGWKFAKKTLGPTSGVYYVKGDADTGDPAIGLKAVSFQVGSTWKAENVTLTAQLYRAAEFSTVSMSVRRLRGDTGWVALAGLQRSTNGTLWSSLWTETAPAAPYNTWNSSTHNSVSVASGSKYLQLIVQGGLTAGPRQKALLEALTCTVVFPSTYLPTGTFLGEQNSYPLAVTFTNSTTGDSIDLDYTMLLNKTFALDGERNTVSYNGYSAYDSVTLNDEGRSAYIRLQAGVNALQITGEDFGELDIDMRFYKRRL